ncbi:c-type cytochrome [Rhizobium terrae]|uniref:c-type cytochrome n=1 Tax=Rhizobium terrae TaxID=2171756 RepID=UPI000E3EBA6D
MVLAVATASTLALFWLTVAIPRFPRDEASLRSGDAARGRLVFAAAYCSSCHATPGQTDPLKLGGGLALASPYGTFRVPNISADPVDGIGSWSVADLANALIAGVSPGRQHYYPAFPYTSYSGMSLEDIRDLYAYLRTLPAVAGRPPAHDLPLPFRLRRAIGLWKLMFFDEGKAPAAANQDRGAYLSETLGHCAECHSSRNMLGAIKPETRFAGGVDPEGSGFAPNITPERIGRWTEADIANLLKTGQTPDHGRVGSSMADVVTNTAALPQSDRDAIARYVKSLPARPTPRP